jgi:AcrR family transcriptional regulator
MASDIRERIIDTAWKLFHEKGFSETTINDIIREAGISKGTFYYYFRSKDNLLDTLSVILDAEYERLSEVLPEDMSSFEKLIRINYEVHTFINDNIDYRLLAYLYSAQIIKEHNSSLLDRNRYYFRFLEQIMNEGSKKGELTDDMTVTEMVKFFGFGERALITDWCMNNGSYSLGEYSREMFPKMMMALKKDSSAN